MSSWPNFLGNAANAVTVVSALVVVAAFCWRVLRRLSQIVHLLREVATLKVTVTDHGLRIAALERFAALEHVTALRMQPEGPQS